MEEMHKIKLVIAGRTYVRELNPDQEAIARKAAKRVDDKITALRKEFPSVSEIDILTIVAMNESIELMLQQESQGVDNAGLQRLADSLQKYVDLLK